MKNQLITLTAVSLFAASTAQAQRTTPAVAKPKLAVVLVIDQFRHEYLARYDKFFGPGGFKRLQREGALFSNARYGHATTYTGPGHAHIASGSYGHTSGIIGNRWFNRNTNRLESMFFDANAQLIGLQASPKDDDTSPRNFWGSMTGDQLRLSNGMRSKVIGLSNKDRAAIMLAGKTGQAYWFHEGAGGLTSSTYYGAQLPQWVQNFNARKLPDAYFNKAWTKALPEEAYYPSRRDDFPAETDVKGLGRTFPHTLTDESGKPTTAFYEAFTATPFATDYQLEVARAAIENEALGVDEYTDLLGLSITATDIAGHAYGPDSQEVQDMIVRLDYQLAGFFQYLDRRFKRGEVVLALTADHGACPLPEYLQTLGIEAGRIKSKTINDAVEAELTRRFGTPNGDSKWVLAVEDPGIYLNRTLIAERKLDAGLVQRAVGEAVLTVPGMSAFFTREGFLNRQSTDRYAQMYERAFHPERSGDVLFQSKPFYFNGSYGNRETGSTHGSPYDYDTHVPLLFWGAGVKPGSYAQPVAIADLAPTLCALLGISAPAGNEGKAISDVMNVTVNRTR
jgi:predicted AlkP superfamily pyrophosphatase or phosphodiesterase